ncbi:MULTISPECIES: copper resistance CopC family protein [Paenibacillus]|uniref:copper resistance CopC family protein n=1 Tax=Paenibacillus TaxID=44249 RepID=UPI00203AAAE2|nr:copper resistance protein CopC [Paenibacillus camelliae]MCM3632401.1 copper resistance protein CopC [Paenibacillus camelliae]
MKKILMLCVILFVLMPVQAFAHSKLTESIPAEQETLSESPAQISLKYNTSISSVSTFTLVNESGEEQQVDNISVNDNELSGEVQGTLANGNYSIEWNIIGADGHAIKGTTAFTVQAAEPEPTETASNTEQDTDATEPTEEPIDEQTAEEPTAEPSPEATPETSTDTSATDVTEEAAPASEKSAAVWPYVVIGLIIIAVVAFAMRKRK